jgi:GNAT superfamily N-acetyltransferase
MNPELAQRIKQTWAQEFGLPIEKLNQPGTTRIPDESRTPTSWITFYQTGEQTLLRIAPDFAPEFEAILAEKPGDHRLTAHDLAAKWGAESLILSGIEFYALDAAAFKPFRPAERFTARQLTLDDRAAFDAFQATCSPKDVEEAELAIDQMVVHGVLDGARIVSVASVYEWRGFLDIGVMTDPAYRQQGLGKAAVTPICQQLMNHERVVVYRHDSDNVGSGGVARGLGLAHFASMEVARRKA